MASTSLLLFFLVASAAPSSLGERLPWIISARGGAKLASSKGSGDGEVFADLTDAIEERFRSLAESSSNAEKLASISPGDLEKALVRLSTSQSTFKGLDGAAHEAYQRTHTTDEIDTSVVGSAQRSAVRTGATAEALLACELIELVEFPQLTGLIGNSDGDEEHTLTNREVLLNITADVSTVSIGGSKVGILVLFEEYYSGGSGLNHGSLEHFARRRNQRPKGRLLIVLSDGISDDLVRTFGVLDRRPRMVQLSSGLVANEIVSVQSSAYSTAGDLLEVLEPTLRVYNTSAIHFIGRSLAGAVANLAATILDGTLPMPNTNGKGRKRGKKKRNRKPPSYDVGDASAEKIIAESPAENSTQPVVPLSGLGRARSSSLSLGSPPCLSSNVVAAFCTSFVYGDDIVSRTSSDSIERLCRRMRKQIAGNIIGRNMGWMTDTLSMTVSSLKTHAEGSEGEEARLSVPGRAFLLRPRRLGGICSIHEFGSMTKGGREAIRAGVLWQLNDILLSKSMAKHHTLESYIHGLDRVRLREIEENYE